MAHPVQTFLPFADYRRCAEVLDDRRLGKQRVEVLQILNALHGKSRGWQTHPAVLMWRGYEAALVEYGLTITAEWRRRGFRDTCWDKIAAYAPPRPRRPAPRPPWLTSRKLHRSHRSALVRKAPEHYRRYFPRVPADLPYHWPSPPPPP